jgi:hypothetical protein
VARAGLRSTFRNSGLGDRRSRLAGGTEGALQVIPEGTGPVKGWFGYLGSFFRQLLDASGSGVGVKVRA